MEKCCVVCPLEIYTKKQHQKQHQKKTTPANRKGKKKTIEKKHDM